MHLFCFSQSYRHGMSAKFVKFRANTGYALVSGVQWPWLPCPFKFNGVENRDLAGGGSVIYDWLMWEHPVLYICVCVQNCVSMVWMLCGCGLWFYFSPVIRGWVMSSGEGRSRQQRRNTDVELNEMSLGPWSVHCPISDAQVLKTVTPAWCHG